MLSQALAGRAVGGHPAGRIGPNALSQPVRVLRERFGDRRAAALVERAIGHRLDALPDALVDEAEVSRLHRALMAEFGESIALGMLAEAGARTGDYLLAHRIPKPAQLVLRHLPRRIALRLLAQAMARHAWTFAGTGRFAYRAGRRPVFELAGCPLCRGMTAEGPVCSFYAGTFGRLVRALVAPHALVTETTCHARGDDACRFTVSLDGRAP